MSESKTFSRTEEKKRIPRGGDGKERDFAFVLLMLSFWITFFASLPAVADASGTKENWLALVRDDHSLGRYEDLALRERMGIRFNTVHVPPRNGLATGGRLSNMKIYEFMATKDEAMSLMYEKDGILDSSVWYLEKNHPIYVVGELDKGMGGNANKKIKWLDETEGVIHSQSSQNCRFSNDGGIPGFNPGYFSWGIDLLDQQSSALNLEYCPSNGMTGSGVNVHILDTGIYLHTSLDSQRIIKTFDFFEPDSRASDFCLDEFGHGTHTACLVASSFYGGAPSANMYVYKVLNDQGTGSLASLASGLAAIYAANFTKGIVSMSLGAGNVVSTVVSTYVHALIQERGFVFVVAAGNGNEDACENFPANIPGVISVGAIDVQGSRDVAYSNYGTCVSVFSPGTNIISCGISNPDAYQLMTGTSMATPIVASAFSVIWEAFPSYDAAQITSIVLQNTVKNSIANVGAGSPNYRIYDGSVNPTTLPGHASTPPQPPTPPTPPSSPPSSPPSGGEGIPNSSPSPRMKLVWILLFLLTLAILNSLLKDR